MPRLHLREDGACVLVDVMSDELRSRVNSELQPFIAATPTGRDDFTGRLTGRTGALVARSTAARLIFQECGSLPPLVTPRASFGCAI